MVIMTYLYRDASNNKEWNVVGLSGNLPTLEERKVIEKALESGEYFIPEQLGLPLLRFGTELNCDDLCWCELDPYNAFEMKEKNRYGEIQECGYSVEEIVERFRRIAEGKETWRELEYSIDLE